MDEVMGDECFQDQVRGNREGGKDSNIEDFRAGKFEFEMIFQIEINP